MKIHVYTYKKYFNDNRIIRNRVNQIQIKVKIKPKILGHRATYHIYHFLSKDGATVSSYTLF